jgi:NhaP-type Na+/H+ or K+/H+ antiporter
MLESIALVILMGLLFGWAAKRLGLPAIVGMLVCGIVLGPSCLNVLDSSLLDVSTAIRKMALVIILVKAGLALDLKDLRRVGRPAILLSFVPASFEICGYVLFAPLLLGISLSEAALMGSVLAAVSPAVVVPRMVKLMEEKRGTKKGVPQMILAGASCDDVFVIVLFSAFLGGSFTIARLFEVPMAILAGLAAGWAAGKVLSILFRQNQSPIVRTLILLSCAFVLTALEDRLPIPFSGLLGVMAMAMTVKSSCSQTLTTSLSRHFGTIWTGAEILLFVLVGAAVNVSYTLNAGPMAVLLILLALAVRTAGVFLCMLKTDLNWKERLFAALAYLPKATVQAAIGSVPLAMGMACGNIILSVAVLGILITAPLGALAIDRTSQILLE